MASPNVVNLAAKLIALDPKLTPEQTIALMKQGATPSADGRTHLIDPQAAIELLKQQQAKEKAKRIVQPAKRSVISRRADASRCRLTYPHYCGKLIPSCANKKGSARR